MKMLITTKANIKSYLEIADTGSDTLLTAIALAASSAVEHYIARDVEEKEREVFFDVEPGQHVFSLRAYPVTECEVYNDVSRAFDESSLVDDDDYSFLGDEGELIFDLIELVAGAKVLKVVYTGGLAKTQALLETNYPDLELAARVQGAYMFQNKTKLGVASEGVQGASVGYQKFEMLPIVKEMLAPFRRIRIA